MSNDLAMVLICWLSATAGIGYTILKNVQSQTWWKQPFVLGSIAATVLLAGYSTTPGSQIPSSLLGSVWLKNLPIILLILSFAYLAISLDHSGFFKFCAIQITAFSKGNGGALFINMFVLVSVLTVFTSNDIVILTMTPIMIYIGKGVGLQTLKPYLLGQFFAANILSMVFYVGSPTNIVIADRMGWSFLDYARWMIVPGLAAGAVALGACYLVFKCLTKEIPYHFRELSYRERHFTTEMKIKTGIFAGLLITLAITSLEGWHVDIAVVCCLFAGIAWGLDLYILKGKKIARARYFKTVRRRMPWAIIPFAMAFFYITAAFGTVGLTDEIAKGIAVVIDSLGDPNAPIPSLGAIIVMGLISAGLVNILNDIPASAMLADILHQLKPIYPQTIDHLTVGVLIGVNPGVNITIAGSLAGLMWINIIKTQKPPTPTTPTTADLTKYGALIMITVILVGCIAGWFAR